MSGNSQVRSDPFVRYEALLQAWLNEVGGFRIDAYCNAVHLVGENEYWLTSCRGEGSSVRPSREVRLALPDVRPSQADPHRGAWLYSHFWMEAAEGVLHQECDWMREPVIDNDEPVMDGDAALELDQFPRDPEWIPEWMATKAASYHKEAERRERRRQRDRERRAKKKAEAAQAEGTSGSDGPAGE